MAHFSELDENNIVIEVITGRNEDEVVDGITNWENYYGSLRGKLCKRTSYNNNYRKNYAGVGMIFDGERDAFYAPQPYPSWTLDEDTCHWKSPVPYPTDNKVYKWNEDTQNWVEVE
jgi:hypothetical protein